jgi:hypothetical protein
MLCTKWNLNSPYPEINNSQLVQPNYSILEGVMSGLTAKPQRKRDFKTKVPPQGNSAVIKQIAQR